MTDTFNDQALTFLIKEVKGKIDRLEEQNITFEKTLYKMTTNHEHMEAIIKTLMEERELKEERKQNYVLLWIKENEKLVRWVVAGVALTVFGLRASQESIVAIIKLLAKQT